MNTYHIIIKKGTKTQEYDLESEETYHALAHRLWDETFDHGPLGDYTVNVGRESYMPCYISTDADPGVVLAAMSKKLAAMFEKAGMVIGESYSERQYITTESALTSMLAVKAENVVAVIDESYPEHQKRANEALARVLAERTTLSGLCTYHVTIKRDDQVQEYDMDSSEYYINVAKRLWKENFSHKPTWEETVSAYPPEGYYVPRHIIDDRVDDLPPENAVWVDGDPDPKRRWAVRDAMDRAREERIKARGMIAYHVTVKRIGKVAQEYDVESDEGARKLNEKIWNENFNHSPGEIDPSDRNSFWNVVAAQMSNHGNRYSSHRSDGRGNSVTVEKKKK